jgi:hypothetical protein
MNENEHELANNFLYRVYHANGNITYESANILHIYSSDVFMRSDVYNICYVHVEDNDNINMGHGMETNKTLDIMKAHDTEYLRETLDIPCEILYVALIDIFDSNSGTFRILPHLIIITENDIKYDHLARTGRFSTIIAGNLFIIYRVLADIVAYYL